MNSILDLLGQKGIQINRVSNEEYASACPGCGGKDRFRIWPVQSNGRYWCRQCQKKGDVIQFARDFMDMNFKEACLLANKKPGLGKWSTLRNKARKFDKPTYTRAETKLPSELWIQRAGNFVKWAANNLWSDKGTEARRWLNEERFLSDDTIRAVRLGWVDKDYFLPRERFGLPHELNANGRPKKIAIPAGLTIPLFNSDGQVIRVRIRRERLFKDERYCVIPGGSSCPMVIGADRNVYVVVESELDAILLSQDVGDLVGVVALGSCSIRPDDQTAELLKKAQKILVALDSDEAGAKQSWTWWKHNCPNSIRWPAIRGKDPTEAKKNGLDLRIWLLTAIPSKEVSIANRC